MPQDPQGGQPAGPPNSLHSARRGQGQAEPEAGGGQIGPGHLRHPGQGDRERTQSGHAHLHDQGAPELGADADEEPAGDAARGRLPAEVHRGDAGNAAAGQSAGDCGGHAGHVQGDDARGHH